MNIYEFIDNKFSDDDMYRSNVARRGISRIAGKGVEQMQGGNRNREGGSMNKKSHEEELQEHINALEQKLEEEVKENIKHLGDLRYYEEVQIPELQEQLAEARAEIESLTRSLTIVANWKNVKRTYTADEVKEFARGILDVAALEAAERGGE